MCSTTEVLQEVEHLGAHRDVERGHRLVGHYQARVERQGAGDADALALATGEGMRVATHVLRPQPDFLEQLLDAPVGLGTFGELVDRESLAHDRADRHARIERRERVLKDDLHLAPQPPQRRSVEVQHILSVEHHVA